MAQLDDWDDTDPGREPSDDVGAAAQAAVASAPELPVLRFLTVDEFVREFLAEALWFDTAATSRIWCPEWWRHPAAIVRLDALHRAFEALRQDPALGISIWLRDHADPHMSVLTDPQGPFKGCTASKGHQATRDRLIPTVPAPEGLFEHDD